MTFKVLVKTNDLHLLEFFTISIGSLYYRYISESKVYTTGIYVPHTSGDLTLLLRDAIVKFLDDSTLYTFISFV